MSKWTEIAKAREERLRQIHMRWVIQETDPAYSQVRDDLEYVLAQLRRVESLHNMEIEFIDYMMATVETGEWQQCKEGSLRIARMLHGAWSGIGDHGGEVRGNEADAQ